MTDLPTRCMTCGVMLTSQVTKMLGLCSKCLREPEHEEPVPPLIYSWQQRRKRNDGDRSHS